MLGIEEIKRIADSHDRNRSMLYPMIVDRVKRMNCKEEEIAFAWEFICFEYDYANYAMHMIENALVPEKVIDVGCQFGFQSEFFVKYMDYVGIDCCKTKFFNSDNERCRYYREMFPNITESLEGATVISNMSLGYFNNDVVTDDIIVEKLSTCKTLYIGSTPSIVDRLKPYFNNTFQFYDCDDGHDTQFPRVAMWM